MFTYGTGRLETVAGEYVVGLSLKRGRGIESKYDNGNAIQGE